MNNVFKVGLVRLLKVYRFEWNRVKEAGPQNLLLGDKSIDNSATRFLEETQGFSDCFESLGLLAFGTGDIDRVRFGNLGGGGALSIGIVLVILNKSLCPIKVSREFSIANAAGEL